LFPFSLSIISLTDLVILNRPSLSWCSVATSMFALCSCLRTFSTKGPALSSALFSWTMSQTLSALRRFAGITILSTSKPTGAMWTRRFRLLIIVSTVCILL